MGKYVGNNLGKNEQIVKKADCNPFSVCLLPFFGICDIMGA